MKFIITTIVVIFISVFNGYTQIRKSLKNDNLRFDYTSFVEKAQNYSDLSIEEQQLAAEIAYKLHLDTYALQLISELEIKLSLTPRLKTIKQNLLAKQKLKSSLDPAYKVDFLFGMPNSDEFLSIVKPDSILWFSSNLSDFSMIQKTDIRTNNDFIELFTGENKNGKINKIDKIKSDKYNCGPVAKIGDNYLLTSNYKKGLDRTNLKLTLVDESLKTIAEFPYNSKAYSVGHATFDSLNKVVYFASDMPLGNGETDIWKVSYNNEVWGVPEKLSETINTPGNELFPTVNYPYLYFASDGHPGLGNLDIYRINLQEDEGVYHYNAPINSRFDDYGLIWISENNGFLNSRRKTGTDDDIYVISKNDWKFDCERKCDNSACVQFVVEEYLSIQPNRFEFFWNMANDTILSGISVSHCFQTIGNYEVSLSVKDLLTDEVIENAMTKTIEITGLVKNLPRFIVTNPVHVDSLIVIEDAAEIEKSTITKEVWEFSDGTLYQDTFPLHSIKTPGYHSITRYVKIGADSCCYQSFYSVFEVQSPSNQANGNSVDSSLNNISKYETRIVFLNADGSSSQNVRLNIADQNGVVLYDSVTSDSINYNFEHLKNYSIQAIDQKGEIITTIHSSANKTEEEFKRLVIQFGVSKPSKIIHVMDEKGVLLSEVKIKKSDSEIGTSDFNGNYNLDLQTKPDDFYFTKVGYWLKKVPITQAEILKKDTLFVVLRKINLGDTIRLENINFDLNKDNIRPDAAKILNELVVTLSENLGLKIKLEAHTDARGSDSYNLDLSKRRAKSSIEFIIKQGIQKERISSEGKGETVLKNHCKNGVVCEDKVHEENRRVEVIIVEYE